MNAIAAAIVVFAGAIVFGAGVLAGGMDRHQGGVGLFFGFLLMVFGGVPFAVEAFKPLWNLIPGDQKEKLGQWANPKHKPEDRAG